MGMNAHELPLELPMAFYTPIIVAAVLGVAALSCIWLWALFDCARNPHMERSQRRRWLVTIFFLHFIGGALYFAYHRETSGPEGRRAVVR
jgi:hypothetical protein